jgi:hypothetical protein
MSANVTPEQVAALARLAGFDFDADRCVLLASQLDWLKGELAHVYMLDLTAEEPAICFQPAAFSSQRDMPDHG